jgi:hypothetical protein
MSTAYILRDSARNREWDEMVDRDDCDNEHEASDEQINIAVAQIKRIARCANLEFALRVGAVIIHHVYDGDTSAWRSKGPKTSSFRRLAQHSELPLSAGSLYRCVALFELCERLNAPSRWQHLGASHLRMVLGLPRDAQERVLVTANENRWTVKALQHAIAREKATRTTRGGRRPQPPISKSLRTVKKCLEEQMDVIRYLQTSSRDEIEQSFDLMEETRVYLESLSQSLLLALGRCNESMGLMTESQLTTVVGNEVELSRATS